MASSSLLLLLFSLLLSRSPICLGGGDHRGTFRFEVHQRYSDSVRRWAESMTLVSADDVWPEKRSLHYYASLVARDRYLLHRRGLAETGSGPSPILTFEDGNATVRLDLLGFLHYANVSIGTPRVNFLVALDTGSDLFWVPCDCQACAPASNRDYGVKFNIYNSSLSSTSKTVSCGSSLCDQQLQTQCTSPSDACPYTVEYLSANLSTSGVLLEDLLHLTTDDDSQQESLTTDITFGCSAVQTGAFFDSVAPNGLLGLSMDNLSVPSILANEGLTSNSFSMCFGKDGLGRISFGDKGSKDQKETPFDLTFTMGKLYVVKIIGSHVGGTSMAENTMAIVDSGTSMTTLTEPIYSNITTAFDSQVKEERVPSIQGNPFEYCYALRTGQTSVDLPVIKLTMDGGSDFLVLDPIILLKLSDSRLIFCLGILNDDSVRVNIIGQNFLTGHQIVFDREKFVFGWTESNCYDNRNSTILSRNGTADQSSPAAPPMSSGGANISPTVIPTLPSMPLSPTSHGHSLFPPAVSRQFYAAFIFLFFINM